MKKIFCIITLLSFILQANAITYTRQDSLTVVRLLSEGAKDNPKNLMLYYGMKLEGIPYVAHTLEVNKSEQLVVNMRQMDCTTFVETVLALALTTKEGSRKWADYCKWLETIRYKDGKRNGYTSRNHYFLWWTDSNKRLGLVSTPMDDDIAKRKQSNTKQLGVAKEQKISINYMSTHSSAYKMLKGKTKMINEIAKMERASTGRVMMYIPAARIGIKKQQVAYTDNGKQRFYVEDGDILAIATKKAGLDTSHIGIVQWGKDGKLHLLNASQIHKKVILEPMSLEEYMKNHPSQLGVWVIRPIF